MDSRSTARITGRTVLVLILLAAMIGVVLTVAGVGDEADDEARVDSARECVAAQPSPLEAVPNGFELGDLPPGRRAELEMAFAAGLQSELIDYIESKTVSDGGRRVGYAVALPGMPQEEFAEFEAGFTDSVGEQGGTVEHATIAGEEVLVGETPASAVVAGVRGCYVVAVGAVDRRSSEMLAKALIGG